MATLVESVPIESFGFEDERGYFLFRGGGLSLYDRLLDWADEHRGVKIVYLNGDVLIMARTRRHDRIGHRVNHLVFELARAAGVPCEDAGETTYRRPPHVAGAQGDDAYYFRGNAEHMAGQKDDDPVTDPVPDLILEVEVHHPVPVCGFCGGPKTDKAMPRCPGASSCRSTARRSSASCA